MTPQDEPIEYPFPPSPSLFRPSPRFEQLGCPVAPVRTPDGNPAWLVTGYSEVRRVLTDPRFSRAAASTANVPLTGLARLARESLLGMDPPSHTRLRNLIGGAFTAHQVEKLRPWVASMVDELLVSVRSQPQPVDLVMNFSLPLPVHVICELLGVPEEDRHILHSWSDTVMGDWQQDPQLLDQALESLIGYFEQLVAAKRAHPADDLISELIAVRDEEQERLTERELVVLCVGLLVTGHETTVSEINMFVLALMHHPDEFARLRADPGMVPQAVEELLRFAQISVGGGTLPRVATEEVSLGGVQLPAGAVVMTATTAANRDLERFPQPHRLDLSRTGVGHLTFGAGAHYCLGAPLARMELQEALSGLLRHLPPEVRLAVPKSELQFQRGMFIRSLEALPVVW